MAEVYVLMHRDAGLGGFFSTREEADQVRRAVVRDEPAWEPLLWVERLEWDSARDEPIEAGARGVASRRE